MPVRQSASLSSSLGQVRERRHRWGNSVPWLEVCTSTLMRHSNNPRPSKHRTLQQRIQFARLPCFANECPYSKPNMQHEAVWPTFVHSYTLQSSGSTLGTGGSGGMLGGAGGGNAPEFISFKRFKIQIPSNASARVQRSKPRGGLGTAGGTCSEQAPSDQAWTSIKWQMWIGRHRSGGTFERAFCAFNSGNGGGA